MKRNLIRIVFCLAGFAIVALLLRVSPLQTVALAKHDEPSAAENNGSVVLASPGRIEGRSETVLVGAATDGVVQSILVHEGQRVTRGQELAEIGCSDLRSALAVTQAEADSARQARLRLLHGSREEERQAAAQKVAAARAVVDQTKSQLDRSSKLWDAAAVSRASFDEAKRDYDVAEAQLKQAVRNEQLVNADPLSEDVARADADVAAADQRIHLSEEKISKCVVRAPMSGTILRVHMREGESFALLSPKPLFSMADLSVLRVRAEVDEKDIRSVHVGQKLTVSTDADHRNRTIGTVTRISPMMGRKSVLTGDPADKSDRDVLEVVADLDSNPEKLPVGLRVTVEFNR